MTGVESSIQAFRTSESRYSADVPRFSINNDRP